MIFSHQYNFFMIFNFLNIIIFLILFVGKAGAAEYFETNSINVINNGPINNLFQLTRPNIEPNHFTGAISLSTQLELSNYISSNLKQDESFFIDGETWVMRNNLSYQFSDNIIISASIPWYKHSGGKADSLIYNWHALFQLPQNGRTENNQDKIHVLARAAIIHEDKILLCKTLDLEISFYFFRIFIYSIHLNIYWHKAVFRFTIWMRLFLFLTLQYYPIKSNLTNPSSSISVNLTLCKVFTNSGFQGVFTFT